MTFDEALAILRLPENVKGSPLDVRIMAAIAEQVQQQMESTTATDQSHCLPLHIEAIRGTMVGMADEERLKVLRKIAKGWCLVCGAPTPCYCDNY